MPQIESASIIGYGFIGKLHAEILKEKGLSVEILEIDRKRREMAEANGFKTHHELGDMLRENFDVVIIATPADQNLLLVDALISQPTRPAILLEKPVATNLVDAKKIERLVNYYGAMLQVGFTGHYHPELVKAVELIQNGSIGEVIAIRENWHLGGPNLPKNYMSRQYGGIVMLNGVHAIDHLHLYAPDLQWQLESATVGYDWGQEAPDRGHVRLKANEEISADISFLWPLVKTALADDLTFEIQGTKGKIRVIGFDRVELHLDEVIQRYEFHKPEDDLTTRHMPGLRAQDLDFIRAFQLSQASPVPISYGVFIQGYLSAIHELAGVAF